MAATQRIWAQRRGEDNLLKEKKGDLSAVNMANVVVGVRRAGRTPHKLLVHWDFDKQQRTAPKRENIQRVLERKENSFLVAGVRGHTRQIGWRW